MTMTNMERFAIEPLLGSKNVGDIVASLSPELFVKAFRDKFSGVLLVQSQENDRVVFRFQDGLATRWHSLTGDQLIKDALGEHLPPEQVDLVEQHALQFEVDELSAVQRLCLLPSETLRRIHQDCMLRELVSLTEKSGSLRYIYQAHEECIEGQGGLEHPVPLLPLLADCLLQASDLSWYRHRIIERRKLTLVLQGEAAKPELRVQGVLRQVVLSLRRQPDSFENLRLRRIAHEDALIAIVYSLYASGCVTHSRSTGLSSNRATPSARTVQPPLRTTLPPSQPHASRTSTSVSGVRVIDLPPSMRAPSARQPSTPSPGPESMARPVISSAAQAAPTPPLSQAPRVGKTASAHKTASSSNAAPSNKAVQTNKTPPRDEHATESQALDAWMRAVDEPKCRKKALKVVQRASEYFPQNPRVLFYLGCLYALCERLLEAEATMLRVLELDPEHTEAGRELAKIKKRGRSNSSRHSLFERWTARRSG